MMSDLLQDTGEVERKMRSITPTETRTTPDALLWWPRSRPRWQPGAPLTRKRRVGPSLRRTEVPSLIGIRDGDTLPTTPTINFGLRNIDIASANQRDHPAITT